MVWGVLGWFWWLGWFRELGIFKVVRFYPILIFSHLRAALSPALSPLKPPF